MSVPSSRRTQRPVVVLPAPDSPTSANVSPAVNRKADVVDDPDGRLPRRNRSAPGNSLVR